jgi:hypothetical protein
MINNKNEKKKRNKDLNIYNDIEIKDTKVKILI